MMWASSRLRSRSGVFGSAQSLLKSSHRDQPLADGLIEDELILLACALSIFAGFR